jgi:hypothetical protein
MTDSPDEDMFELHLPKYYTDHFTLPAPSSTVRFWSKHSAARVFKNKTTHLACFPLQASLGINDSRYLCLCYCHRRNNGFYRDKEDFRFENDDDTTDVSTI